MTKTIKELKAECTLALEQKENQCDTFVRQLIEAQEELAALKDRHLGKKGDLYNQLNRQRQDEYQRRRFAERKMLFEYQNVEAAIDIIKEALKLIDDTPPFQGKHVGWLEKANKFLQEIEEGKR